MKLHRLTPLAEVQSVARSIEFYSRLGFEVGNTFVPADDTEPTWAWLRRDDVDFMIARAETAHPARPTVLFYLYCDDVSEARSQLVAAGLACTEIVFPFYSPKGEFEIEDPDGYKLVFSHT